jgi:PAS domain S-box-containing protein
LLDSLVLIALGFGLLYWILEAAVHAFVLRDGYFTQHVLTTDAHEVWMRVLVISLLVGFGASIQVVLGQRRRAQESLREREARLRNLLDTMAEGVIRMDTEGRIVQANPAAERILGLTRSQSGSPPYAEPEARLLRPDGTLMPEEEMPGNRSMRQERPVQDLVVAIQHPGGTRSWLNVNTTPLLAEDGEVEGAVAVFVDITPLKTTQERLEASHANLEKQVEERTVELTRQTAKLATTQERERLARELHDSVSQTLYSASLIAEATPRVWERDPEEGRRRLDEMRLIMRGAMVQMRTLLLELRPAALAKGNLGDLLRQLAESIGGHEDSPVHVDIKGRCTLPPKAKVALYRIAQEAMTNAVKHAGARRIELSLCCRNGRVELSIRDDGHGFEPEKVPAGGLGLGIMRERAETSGAAFTIESRPGRGTRVTAVWSQSTDEH